MSRASRDMHITSFTQIADEDKMANIDSSSMAHLTLNAAVPNCSAAASARGSNTSDSDQDRSPSVTVLKPNSNSEQASTADGQFHHINPLLGPSQLIRDGISFSCNRMSFSKSQRHSSAIWHRASQLEKVLLLTVSVLSLITILTCITLMSISDCSQKQQEELDRLRLQVKNHPEMLNATTTVPAIDDKKTSSQAFNGNETSGGYCITPSCVKVAASVIEAIDLTVDPCDDFYMYSCGDWIKSNPLPDGKSNWGTFSKLWQDNQAIMRSVLGTRAEGANFTEGSAEQKAKIYYESCLDRNDTVETRGTKPMEDLIESAGGWNISKSFDVKTWNLQNSLQLYHNQYNRGGLFSWAVGADERNSTRNIIQLDQGGLGLPSRDYYLNKTDKNVVLDAYLMYMIKVAELMGGSDVRLQMEAVLEFEKQLAQITVPQDQRRDDERMYHKYTLKELNTRSPFLNWTKYFDDAFDYHSRTSISFSSEIKLKSGNRTSSEMMGGNQTEYTLASAAKGQSSSSFISKHKITEEEHVVIYSPEYFEDLSYLITNYTRTDAGRETLSNYLAWSVIQSLIATLPKNFRDASKVLRKALIGSEGIEVSWRYCVTDTNQVMGFALGSLFVRRVFQGKSKERAEEMIYSIRNAFTDNLASIAWMDDKTRGLAREKADHINQMIGFPDFILSPEVLNNKYEGLELDENNFFENNIKVNILSLRENMEKISKPANKTEWEMTPPMVNAYYTPTKNQIVFPAGILQSPFYDVSYPNALNYGAMGVVMGHELTHAFDDQGREYDKDGNLYQWWHNETLKNFEERVKCFVNQYSSYKVDDNSLNGRQTLGENIADNGGLKAAFRAYEKWSDTRTEVKLPGLNLTNKQLFFVLNDPHAPAQFRVIGTLSNSDEFAKEFNCPVGSKMNPEKKCIVW